MGPRLLALLPLPLLAAACGGEEAPPASTAAATPPPTPFTLHLTEPGGDGEAKWLPAGGEARPGDPYPGDSTIGASGSPTNSV